MQSLRATQKFDSLYRRLTDGKTKEDDEWHSMDDAHFRYPPSSSESMVFQDYCFSDDDEARKSMHESLYLDEVSGEAAKEKHLKKHDPQPARPSGGALEELFAAPASAKISTHVSAEQPPRIKTTTTETNAPMVVSSTLKNLASQSLVELRKTWHPSTITGVIPNDRKPSWLPIKNQYNNDETSDSDDENVEFGSDSTELPLHNKSSTEQALAIIAHDVEDSLAIIAHDMEDSNTILETPRQRRLIDALSLSTHTSRNREEESPKSKRSKQRAMDALSISHHGSGSRRTSKGSSSTLKPRSSSQSAPRRRRSSKKKMRGTSSSPKRSSSVKSLPSRRRRMVDDDSKNEPRRRSSSKSKPSRRSESLDECNLFDDASDNKSQTSASTSRKKKGSKRSSASSVTRGMRKKDLDQNSNHSPKRSSSVKRKKNKDQLRRSSQSPKTSDKTKKNKSSTKTKPSSVSPTRTSSFGLKRTKVPLKWDNNECSATSMNLSSSEHFSTRDRGCISSTEAKMRRRNSLSA